MDTDEADVDREADATTAAELAALAPTAASASASAAEHATTVAPTAALGAATASGAQPFTVTEPSPFAHAQRSQASAPPRTPTTTNDALEADLAAARGPSPIARAVAFVQASRRNMAIVAGGAGLLVIVSALAFCGGGSSSKPSTVVAKTDQASDEFSPTTDSPAAALTDSSEAARSGEATAGEDAARATGEDTSGTGAPGTDGSGASEGLGPTPEELAAAAEAEPDEAATTATTTANTGTTATRKATGGATRPKTTAAATSGGKKLGGKQVVLEYDQQARENKPVASAPKADQGAIQKARLAYAQGNQRLFAGDSAGAIRLYRQSLAHYPGYVAGYRGLGLAYAQQGDTAKALQALRMYVRSVPGAKDAALIRKRIAGLQQKK